MKQTMKMRILCIFISLPSGLQKSLLGRSSAIKQKRVLFSVGRKLVTPATLSWPELCSSLKTEQASFSAYSGSSVAPFQMGGTVPMYSNSRSWLLVCQLIPASKDYTVFILNSENQTSFLALLAVFTSLYSTSSMQGISHTGLLWFYGRNKLTNWRGYSSTGLVGFQVSDQIIPVIKKRLFKVYERSQECHPLSPHNPCSEYLHFHD